MSFINKEKEIVEKIMMCILILSFKSLKKVQLPVRQRGAQLSENNISKGYSTKFFFAFKKLKTILLINRLKS